MKRMVDFAAIVLLSLSRRRVGADSRQRSRDRRTGGASRRAGVFALSEPRLSRPAATGFEIRSNEAEILRGVLPRPQ